MRQRGERVLPKEMIRTFVGKGMPNLVRRSLATVRNVPPEALTEMEIEESLAQFKNHYADLLGRETALFPGVREGLERMSCNCRSRR